jgi:anti-sigma regulatory factor (Ser/Thr protein kinase)
LHIPPDPKLGRYVRDEITAFAATLRINKTDIDDFLSAIGEALANAVEHSGVRDEIEVRVWLEDGDRLLGSVVDRGVGFEPAGSPASRACLPDILAERGRGIPIMRSCSDNFSVESAPGQGTAVTIGRIVHRRTAVPGRPIAR